MNFGERLVNARENLGFTQHEFATKLSLAPQSLSRYEKNRVKPSVELVEKLVITFNININWLLTGKGEMLLEEQTISKEVYINRINKKLPSLSEEELQLIDTYIQMQTNK